MSIAGTFSAKNSDIESSLGFTRPEPRRRLVLPLVHVGAPAQVRSLTMSLLLIVRFIVRLASLRVGAVPRGRYAPWGMRLAV